MFYAKLAWSNLKKSLDIFGPFLLASVVLFVLDCSTLLLIYSPVSMEMQYSNTVLGLAIVVLMIFTVIMDIYSYNFLVSSIELAIIFIGVILLGSVLSAVFSQVFYLIFVNLLHYNKFIIGLSPLAFILASVAFAAIFALLEVINIVIIYRSSPLALFKRQEKGEKEPRGNILFALLSLISLGSGYYLSISSQTVTALVVVYRFFIAVVLVIIGTYLFYVSFMTWYLKRRRKNKNYFYKPKHFVTTSQMIFRMKENAIGLANITLLATMSFVTIATTSSLYFSSQKQANEMFPKNTKITFADYGYTDPNAKVVSEGELKEKFQEQVTDKLNKPDDEYIIYQTVSSMFSIPTGKSLTLTDDLVKHPEINKFGSIYLTTQDVIKSFDNDMPDLEDNQVAFYKQKGDSQLETLTLFDRKFENVKNFKNINFPEIKNSYNPGVIIFSNDSVMQEVINLFKEHELMAQHSYSAFVNLSPNEVSTINKSIDSASKDDSIQGDVETRKGYMDTLYTVTGGFLFTGFLLGLSFLLGAALIIYYKQRTEGIEDKKSVHFIVALTMLKQMLLLFGVEGSGTLIISGITIFCIIIIYFFIYKLTSRTYYKIIER